MRILFLMLAWSSLGAPAAAPPSDATPACHVTVQPASAQPPAWLLLSCALVLVGAGRLAAR